MARLAARKQLAKIDILVELDPGHLVADPDDRTRNSLRGQLELDMLANRRRPGDDDHHAARGQVLHLHQLLITFRVGELADAKHCGDAVVVTALGRPWHGGRERYRGRLEGGIAAAESLPREF